MEDNKQGSGKEEDEEEKNGIGHSSSSPSGAVRRGFFVATAQPDPRNIDTRIASTDEDGGETERVVSSDIGGGGECGAIEDEEKNEVISVIRLLDQPLTVTPHSINNDEFLIDDGAVVNAVGTTMDDDGDFDLSSRRNRRGGARKRRSRSSSPSISRSRAKQQKGGEIVEDCRSSSNEISRQEQQHPIEFKTSPATRKLLGQAFEVRHLRATTLPAVGLQLWMGSLVLMDYLLAYAGDVIEGKTVLELGAGTGLVSMLAARLGARHVYATDYSSEILQNTAANMRRASGVRRTGTITSTTTTTTSNLSITPPYSSNESSSSSLVPTSHLSSPPLSVRVFDWLRPPERESQTQQLLASSTSSSSSSSSPPLSASPSSMKEQQQQQQQQQNFPNIDLKELETVDVVIASDVVYDPILTDALASVLDTLLSKGVKAIISCEKRVFFCEKRLREEVYEWPRFLDLLRTSGIKVDIVNLRNVPQFSRYDRNKHLEIALAQRMH